MLYPTIHQLTSGDFNRYELVIATAKCARMITEEYVRQREAAEKAVASGAKDGEKSISNMIDKEYRDEKAVKVAINHIYLGDYTLLHADEVEALEAEREAAAHAIADEAPADEEKAADENESTEDVTASADEDAAEDAVIDDAE